MIVKFLVIFLLSNYFATVELQKSQPFVAMAISQVVRRLLPTLERNVDVFDCEH